MKLQWTVEMTIKTSRQSSLEKLINLSLESVLAGDMEKAIYDIAPVIDVIAKERYAEKKYVGERIKSFILDEQDIIYYLSTQGRIKLPKGVHIVMVDDQNVDQKPPNIKDCKRHAAELADYIYHNIRCAQSHDAEIDYDIIDIGRNFGIGRERFDGDGGNLEPGKFIISNATIISIILAVIAAPEVKQLKLEGRFKLYDKVLIDKATLVGNRLYLEDRIQEIFKIEMVET